MKPFWVYLLRCSDGSYYTGHTDDLERRVAQHEHGEIPGCYTLNRRPLALAYSQAFESREEALAAEQQIKGWSRSKKAAMTRGDWTEVSRLARSRTRSAGDSTGSPWSAGKPVHGSTSSPRMAETVGEAVHGSARSPRTVGKAAVEESVRPEPVEGRADSGEDL